MNQFGKAFRDERLAARMTLRSTSLEVGKSISYLSDVEHGRKGVPDTETVAKLEAALGVTDQRLSKIADEERRRGPRRAWRSIRKQTLLVNALLRADEDAEFAAKLQAFIMDLNKEDQ
jgi:transcriptional regulator with XRE-family HTH domain